MTSSRPEPRTVAGDLLTVVHPGFFAGSYVLLSFANLPTPVSGLWRPLVVAVAAAVILGLVTGLLLRRIRLGALVASGLVLALSAPWLFVVVASATALWIVLVTLLRRVRHVPAVERVTIDGVARLAGVFGLALAAVAAASALPAIAASVDLGPPGETPTVASGRALPNIYVVLLDGYPRSDVLAREAGFDNAPFEEALSDLGFQIPRGSRSNYSATWATLASVFHGEYLDQIPMLTPFPDGQEEQYTLLMRAINRGTVLGDLRARGYRIISVPPPFEGAAVINADEVLSGGQMTQFELSLLQHSPLLTALIAIAPDFVLGQLRDQVVHALRATAEAAEDRSTTPTFFFAHVMSPHAPIVFQADGSLASLPDCLPAACTLWELKEPEQWEAFPGQVAHLNRLVIETLARVVTADPQAVVVVMSDHGNAPPGAESQLLLDNFLAVRAPGHEGLLEPDAHLVDLFAIISDAYFGTNLPRHPYQAWINASEHPLQMRRAD